MPVESAADRAVFVNADEFGVAAIYTAAAAGLAVAVSGILDDPSGRAFGDAGIAVGDAPTFTMRSADLPQQAAGGEHSGDRLAVGDRAFHVRVIERDGTGMTVLTLEEIT